MWSDLFNTGGKKQSLFYFDALKRIETEKLFFQSVNASANSIHVFE